MVLNSTRIRPIWIEKIEWEEPFQSRIGSNSFGTKRHGSFYGVDPGYENPFIKSVNNYKRKSEISQHDSFLFASSYFANSEPIEPNLNNIFVNKYGKIQC
jgi:hypothetical protein